MDAELPRLVWEAMQAGCTWQQVAEALGVSKQRVYQLRAAGKP
ncbi:helix-turn-helix DNA-binding domain protein [Mycobacterium phage IHOP]|uniref:Helix-turn-helix DNA-binding domain protein n=2 Tax=Kostyavirus toto TaxID=1993871 RepID=A0A345KX25_9CAUD|nr:helix-turn-helix DNA-binding domain protein [Mycobacterium phage IHOP]AXH48209.1 helix-turn-helix DNA-binding domain protein [Mycobacterium phage Phaja]